jgi:periplasmic protein CpxP/Spy
MSDVTTRAGIWRLFSQCLSPDGVEYAQGGCCPCEVGLLRLPMGVMLVLSIVRPAVAQDNGAQQAKARQQLQQIHTPQSIDQELAHLTRDLELSAEQQQQVRPLLEQHHDRIQALLDKNPTASREELDRQIHAISDETQREIHALLTDHQKDLEKVMELHGR